MSKMGNNLNINQLLGNLNKSKTHKQISSSGWMKLKGAGFCVFEKLVCLIGTVIRYHKVYPRLLFQDILQI